MLAQPARLALLRLPLAISSVIGVFGGLASAQYVNPGAYTSPVSASNTDGANILFFGNSFTISSFAPLINSPTYGGARGVPELMRQIAIAAGEDPPFVKNVFSENRGLDWHLDPAHFSLGHIEEPMLDGETWTYVVLQGFSMRPTLHPYTGNRNKLQLNALRLFDEVRSGSTNHTTVSPNVIPVLYQTWARRAGHWLYTKTSNVLFSLGSNIPYGYEHWMGDPIFKDPAHLAAQVRTGYELTRAFLAEQSQGAQPLLARAGDAWEAAGFGASGVYPYAFDIYHANNRGDLLSAFMIYGTIYGNANLVALVDSGDLDATLAAINVPSAEARLLATWASQTLVSPPPAATPTVDRPNSLLFDFSAVAGSVGGFEPPPYPGRSYNTVSGPQSGTLTGIVDTEGDPTSVALSITQPFTGEHGQGATGAWIVASDISGVHYVEEAELDGFYLDGGATGRTAEIELTGLRPGTPYDVRFFASRAGNSPLPTALFQAAGQSGSLDARWNLGQILRLRAVLTDAQGKLVIQVSAPAGSEGRAAYLNVLEVTPVRPATTPWHAVTGASPDESSALR